MDMLTDESFSSLTLLDYFAGIALQALLGENVLKNGKITTEMIVKGSYDVAEMMITEKGKR